MKGDFFFQKKIVEMVVEVKKKHTFAAALNAGRKRERKRWKVD